MSRVEIFEPKAKFRKPKAMIADKQERLLEMLRLMALSYHTRPKIRRANQASSDPIFIEVREKQGIKR
jgi:hypothetical protein